MSVCVYRFQGRSKGMIRYSGALLTLLDTPSWTIVLKKLIFMYIKAKDINHDMLEVCMSTVYTYSNKVRILILYNYIGYETSC